jgi:hypothetical protein
MLEHEARAADARRADSTVTDVRVEDLGPVGNPSLGEDQALGAVVSGRQRLTVTSDQYRIRAISQ